MPNSEYCLGPPIIGSESLRDGPMNCFPLLFRLSRARSTSVPGLALQYVHETLSGNSDGLQIGRLDLFAAM